MQECNSPRNSRRRTVKTMTPSRQRLRPWHKGKTCSALGRLCVLPLAFAEAQKHGLTPRTSNRSILYICGDQVPGSGSHTLYFLLEKFLFRFV